MATEQYKEMFGLDCPPNAGDRWSLPDERQLIHLIRNGHSLAYIVDKLGRTRGAVRERLVKMMQNAGRLVHLEGRIESWGDLVNMADCLNWQQYFANAERRELLEKARAMTTWERNDVKKFWMVKMLGGGQPHVQHPTYAKAEAEARRLAAATPGSVFYVLEAVAAAIAPTAVVVKKLEDEEKDDG